MASHISYIIRVNGNMYVKIFKLYFNKFCSYTNVFPPIPSSHTCNKKLTELKGNKIILKNKTFTACPRFVEPVECVIQLCKYPSFFW